MGSSLGVTHSTPNETNDRGGTEAGRKKNIKCISKGPSERQQSEMHKKRWKRIRQELGHLVQTPGNMFRSKTALLE